MGIDLELSGVPVIGELADGVYDLSDGKAEKLSESAVVLLLALVSATVLLTEDVDNGGSPCVKSSQSEILAFDWWISEGGAEAEEGVVDGGTCIMTESTHAFVGALGQLLMGKKSEAWGRREERSRAG